MAFIRFAPDLTDAAFAAEFHRVSATATQGDGYAPFNEQSLFDVAAGHRAPFLVVEKDGNVVVGAGILGAGELDLVVDPARRRHGYGAAALAEILADAPGELTIWSHGDHPAARALADRFAFTAERTLLQLRLDLSKETAGSAPAEPGAPARTGIRAAVQIDAFRPGPDDAEWVALNALVFAARDELAARPLPFWALWLRTMLLSGRLAQLAAATIIRVSQWHLARHGGKYRKAMAGREIQLDEQLAFSRKA